jgi:hypothetical protein
VLSQPNPNCNKDLSVCSVESVIQKERYCALSGIQDEGKGRPQLLRCKICGEMVNSWWMEDHRDNTCKCYKCYGKRWC